jgi:cobalt-zinc-cadmium efflux system membrane fusion protein
MKSPHRKKLALVLMRAAAMLALVGLLGCRDQDKKVAEAPAPKVDGDKVTFPSGSPQTASLVVQAAQPRTLAITHLTGRLYWNDEKTVRIFTPVAGRVIALRADLGDPVEAGAPLAEIDSPDFGQALANTRTAVGNLAMADKALARNKELLAHGAAAQKDVEAAEAAYVAALAEKDRAEAVLANYGGSDKGTNSVYLLRSPLAGMVVDKNINPGQEVRADLMLANAPSLFVPLFVVSDPAKLWLQVDVAESDLSSLQAGQKLQIHSRAFPDRVFDGVVSKIGDSMDSSTRSIKVRGVVNNPDKLLKAEMYVTVDVSQDITKIAAAGVEIPSKAVFMKGNDSYLFIEQAPGEYLRKHVTLGTEKDGKVPVFEGVNPGQKVVVEGALLLQAVVEPAS